MTMKKLAAIAIAMTMCVSMLTACGSDDSSSKAADSTPADSSSAAPAEEEPSEPESSEPESSEPESSEPEADANVIEVNEGVCFNEPYEYVNETDAEQTIVVNVTGVGTEDVDAAYWNDWCTLAITVFNADGELVDYTAIMGSQVGWDTTVYDNGTPDDKEDDYGVPAAECGVLFTGEGEISEGVKPVKVPVGATLKVTALGWADTEESAATDYFEVVSLTLVDAE